MVGMEEWPSGYEFRVHKFTEVSPLTENAAKQAIAMVWDKNIGEPTTFNLAFASRITNPETDEDTGRGEEYDPDLDMFKFALNTMTERLKFGLPEEQVMVIVAAHSAFHKVQFARGENPRTVSMNPIVYEQKEYFNRPEEKSAWIEALHVFKKIYPGAKGSFTTGGVKYSIPNRSKY